MAGRLLQVCVGVTAGLLSLEVFGKTSVILGSESGAPWTQVK